MRKVLLLEFVFININSQDFYVLLDTLHKVHIVRRIENAIENLFQFIPFTERPVTVDLYNYNL